MRDAVHDLHRLINAAHVGPHAVPVGHSNGGFYAVAYAERYPGDVGGLVLVDPGYSGQQNYASYGLGASRAAALRAWAQGLVVSAAHCLALARNGKIAGPAGERTNDSDTASRLDASMRAALRRIYVRVPEQLRGK